MDDIDIKIDRVGKLKAALNTYVYGNVTNPYMTKERAREILLEWSKGFDEEEKDEGEYEKLFSLLAKAVLIQQDKILGCK